MIKDLLDRFRRNDRHALARLLSLAARGQALQEINAAIPDKMSSTRVIAFTGSGGVGKSTLISRLIDVAVKEGQRVAVLACDPESPRTGGALLGDRVRMGSRAEDTVFIRSLATPGGGGAVARHLDVLIRLLTAFGFDVVFLETVGAGQGDVVAASLAKVVVLLVQPETGDDLQWEKAGVFEVADIIAIHKADLPGAEHVAAQVRNSLALSQAQAAPVILVSSQSGQGIAELWKTIQNCRSR